MNRQIRSTPETMTKAMNKIKITALTAALLVMMTSAAGCGKKKADRITDSKAESSNSGSTVSEVGGEEKPDEINVGGEEDKGIAVDFDPNKTPSAASSKSETTTEGKKSESSSGTAVPSDGGKKDETPSGSKDSGETGTSEAESGEQEGMDGYTPWK